jgi:hypothetical protein
MFIPDPGSEFFHPGSRVKRFRIPDPHQRILVFLTQKIVSTQKYDPGCSSRIPDPDLDFHRSRIPGQKGTPRIRVYDTAINTKTTLYRLLLKFISMVERTHLGACGADPESETGDDEEQEPGEAEPDTWNSDNGLLTEEALRFCSPVLWNCNDLVQFRFRL